MEIVLISERNVLRRWKENFEVLINTENMMEKRLQETEAVNRVEVRQGVGRMKGKKAVRLT